MKEQIIYNYSNATFEFTHESIADLDLDGNWALPAFSTELKPMENKDGFAVVFDERTGVWALVPDFRKQIFYSKEDGSKVEIKDIGVISDELTDKAYPGQFYKWSGDVWALDDTEKSEAIAAANKAEKSRRFNDAASMIKMYEEAEADNDILPEELELLKSWRTYQRKINRIADLTQEAINWPEKPE